MQSTLRTCARVASAIAGVVALTGIAGWVFDVPPLRTHGVTGVPMAFNSAVGILLASAAVGLLGLDPRGRWRRVALMASGAAILTLGGLTLSQTIIGWDLRIDRLLHPQEPWRKSWVAPGRMAPASALGFIMLGLVLLGFGRRRIAAAQWLSVATGLLGFLSLLGYLYGAREMLQIGSSVSMALGTASGLLLVSIACLLSRPDRGLVAVVASETLAGVMARRLLPVVIMLPVVVGFVDLLGVEGGQYGPRFGIAMMVSSLVVIGAVVVLATAQRLRLMEEARDRAREMSRRSEERFGRAIAAAPFPILIHAADGRMTTVNDAFTELSGYRREEVLTVREWTRLAYGEGGDAVLEEIGGLYGATGPVEEGDFEVRTASGERRVWQFSSAPLGEDEDGVRLVISMAADVTQQRQVTAELERARADAERRALEAEEGRRTLGALMDNIPEGVSITGGPPDFPLEQLSRRAVELSGRDRSGLVGIPAGQHQASWGLFLADGVTRPRPEQMPLYRATHLGEETRNLEMVMERADGSRIAVLVDAAPIRDARGRIVGGINCWRDVTDLKRAEEARRQEQALLKEVIDATPSMVFVKDWMGRFVMCNTALARVYGTTVDDLLGKTDADFNANTREVSHFLEDDREVMTLRREKLIPEEPVTCADGEVRWFSTMKVPLVNADGSCRRVLGVATDITDRKRIEEALATYNERLSREVDEKTRELRESDDRLRRSERMAFIGTLSAGLGHDIGNLLLPLRARLDSVGMHPGLPSETRDDLSSLREGLDYLGRLARGLRALAANPEATAGVNEMTDLAGWWEESGSLLRAMLPLSATLEWTPPPEGLRARISAAALTQIIFNLVQNAGDALQGYPAGRVAIRAVGSGRGLVRLVVEDNGPGMTPEARDRCLEPFYTTKPRGLSTGMGLTLVHGLVQRAGGTLSVESELGHGAAFTVTLEEATPPPENGERPLAILTVRDDRMSAFISSMLVGMGFVVENGTPNGHPACVWVVDGERGDAASIEEFLGRDGGRRVLLVGPSELNGELSARVVRVGARLNPLELRRVLRAVARACELGTAEESDHVRSTDVR